MPDPSASIPSLGVDTDPVADADGRRGLRVTRIDLGSPAEKSGVRVGDVIRSINGHRTEKPGHLTWIIANAVPDKVLKMIVRPASRGEVRTFTAGLP